MVHRAAWAPLILLLAASGLQAAEAPVSFYQEVMPLLSKGGCNAGACHGNASGKGGLKLSLRGENPVADAAALTKGLPSRRVNVAEPDKSLFLRKPAGLAEHEGGKRFAPDGPEHAVLRRWITEGAQNDSATAPRLVKLEVSPREAVLEAPAREVQITARAEFADGAARDVTGAAVFEASNFVAEHQGGGRMVARQAGETTVTVRFLHLQIPVRLAFIPARPDFQWPNPPAANFIDEAVFAKLRRLKIAPSDLCDEAVFLRRVYLDLLGVPPTAEEARRYLKDATPSPQKREQLIDALLQRPEFGEHWAVKWSDLLRNEEKVLDARGTEILWDWLRDWFNADRPLDELARGLLTGFGSTYQHPAANFYRALRDPATRAETTAQVFLGTRLQCAKCHNHPFEKWTQDDYYRFSALFDGVDYLILTNERRDKFDKHEFAGEQVVHLEGKREFKDPRTGKLPEPGLLDPAAAPLPDPAQRFSRLAEWLTSPQHPLFARVQANRLWQQIMGVGIVDPVDDFRATNPPSNPELLDALAAEFVSGGFRIKPLVRRILLSRTYQLSAEINASNSDDHFNFSHTVVRRLTAEQLVDAMHQALGVPAKFTGLPSGTRAGQFPGVRRHRRNSDPTEAEQFLSCFGKPVRLLPSEAERNNETSLAQVFMLVSGRSLDSLLKAPSNRLTAWVDSAGADPARMVEELFWWTLSRPPIAAESAHLTAGLAQAADRRAALEDIAWAVLNAKEFLLRR